ncbi:MAG: hypothetical protein CSA39_02095 [Flavobacteriales bacterium]|nr:MAG: hypothetical protein CR985_03355 [Flavobacteriales bacterium]PIE49527.1 MAG: hypothetical protein CSA39_02095 [Flavobacteriales bacterium]
MKKNYFFILSLLFSVLVFGQNNQNTATSNTSDTTIQEVITDFKIYPNPVTEGKLYVYTKDNDLKTIQISDILGKTVLQTKLQGTQLNVSSLKAGVYIFRVIENGKVATRKLVIK